MMNISSEQRRPSRHCNYSAISDGVLLRIYEICEGLRNCSFELQTLLYPACNGHAFWTNGRALVLRLEHQCISGKYGLTH